MNTLKEEFESYPRNGSPNEEIDFYSGAAAALQIIARAGAERKLSAKLIELMNELQERAENE